MTILSYFQARTLLDARKSGMEEAEISLDLNVTRTRVSVTDSGVSLSEEVNLPWDSIQEISDTENACFAVVDGSLRKVQLYSEDLNRFYSLYPTQRAPTMLLSGIPMHRIKNVDPVEDTARKMKTIGPVTGETLDICTGLGYTAIAAARQASHVTTIELDPTVIDLCRWNPWSRELFENPKIEQKIGDATEVVETLPDFKYNRIFHDPPAFSIGGELYSGAFYRELLRILKRGGRIYHYIGDLDSTSGRVVVKGVVKRMQEAGFNRVERRPEAFGVIAEKA